MNILAKALVTVAALGLVTVTPVVAAPTVKLPNCLYQRDTTSIYVPCTGVVPIDKTTGNALTWEELFDRVTNNLLTTRVKSQSNITAASTSSQQLFAVKTNRVRLVIQNQDSANAIYINLGAAATVGGGSVRIAPGETREFLNTRDAVFVIAPAGTPAIAAWEF